MPIYEYKCEQCGTKFEKLVRSYKSDSPSCPECGQAKVAMQLSTFAAHSAAPSRGASEAPMGGCGNRCPHPDACGLN